MLHAAFVAQILPLPWEMLGTQPYVMRSLLLEFSDLEPQPLLYTWVNNSCSRWAREHS